MIRKPTPQAATSAVQRRLFRYLRSGRVHPALLLVGPDRETKLEAARQMAQLMLCRQPSDAGPCGKCSPCQRIAKELHPDVLIVREEGEDTIKIDIVRDLCHQMEIGPLEAASKICILDECQRMNSASANAFLKTLEEPGQGRYFFLLTSQPGSLLPTVLSRCLQFTFKPGAEGARLSEPLRQELETLFVDFRKTRSVFKLLDEMDEKEHAISLVQFLQTELRESVVTGTGLFAELSPYDCLARFDEAVKLEGRLRSHANYGLLLETFLRQQFLS